MNSRRRGGRGSNQYRTRATFTVPGRAATAAVIDAVEHPDEPPPTDVFVPSSRRCRRCNQPDKDSHRCRDDLTLAADPNCPPETLRELWGEVSTSVTSVLTPKLAANPNTPPDVLRACFERCVTLAAEEVRSRPGTRSTYPYEHDTWFDRQVMPELAANPNTPPDVVTAGRERDGMLWMRHPSTTETEWDDCYQRVIGDSTYSHQNLLRLLACPNMPSRLLDDVATRNPFLQDHVVAHPSCPLRILTGLVVSEDPDDRAMVAASPAAPDAMIRSLAKDRNKKVRAAAAANPYLDHPATLQALAADRTKDVQFAVVNNPNCPPEGLARACRWFDVITGHQRQSRGHTATADRAEDERRSRLLRTVVQHRNLDEDTIFDLIRRSGTVYAATVGPTLLSTRPHRFPDRVTHQIVYGDDLPTWTRPAYASNPNADPDGLVVLAGDPNPQTLQNLVDNPAADIDQVAARLAVNPAAGNMATSWAQSRVDQFLQRHGHSLTPLTDQCPRCGQFTGQSVHQCPDRTDRPVTSLHRNDRWIIAQQPSTPPDEIADLLFDPDPDIVTAALSNPQVDPTRLHTKISGGVDLLTVTQKTAAAANPACHPDTLEILSADKGQQGQQVRIAVAANPNTSPSTLNRMHASSHQNVRDVITSRSDCRHLAAFDNHPEFRWRYFPQASTDDRPFAVTADITRLRQALADLTAGIDGRERASQLVAVEVGDGIIRFSRCDNTNAAVTVTVPATHEQAGTVVVGYTALQDLLKGRGRGPITLRRTSAGFGTGTEPWLSPNPDRKIPVVSRHNAPGSAAPTLPSAGLTEDLEQVARRTPDAASVLVVHLPDGTRRIIANPSGPHPVAYMTKTAGPSTGHPVGGHLPTRFRQTMHKFSSSPRIELRSRDVIVSDDDKTVIMSRVSETVPPRNDNNDMDRWNRSDHIPVTVNVAALEHGWDELCEMENVAASFVDARVAPPERVTVQLSQIGPDGFVLSAVEYTHTNPFTVGNPDPHGPSVTYRSYDFWSEITAVDVPSVKLWLHPEHPTEIDVGDKFSTVIP